MIRDPNATVPKWNVRTLQKLAPRLQHGTRDLSEAQYQVAKTPAKTVSLKADTKFKVLKKIEEKF